VQLESEFLNSHVLYICRAPKGDFERYLNKLENITYLYKPKLEFVIRGDINADYLAERCHKQCLNSVLTFSNLKSIVDFPTRIQNYSSTVTGNIYIGSSRKNRIYIKPVPDGAKLLVVKKNIESILNYHNYKKQTRLTNNDTSKGLTTHVSNVNLE
jgi:hypothetical protein